MINSWIEVPANSDFPLQNLPFGIFSVNGDAPCVGVRIGDYVIDLSMLMELGYFDGLVIPESTVFHQKTLNNFIALGKSTTLGVRQRVMDLLKEGNSKLRDYPDDRNEVVKHISKVKMHLPVQIGDYTDFYSSIEHATNVGTMFRDPANALLPNWKHLPVGYHGRASSIVISGTEIIRPKGQFKPEGHENPSFGATRLLDFELEMGFIVGKTTEMGDSVPAVSAEDYIFGFVIFNDWSARDIQSWEYVPLGPFLGKNFASTMSAWVVTIEALENYRTASPTQDVEVFDYLKTTGKRTFDIKLEVALKPVNSDTEMLLCRSNFKYLYWNISQQLAHHTVNGCPINVGDLYASGTISGKEPSSFGSMLELSWKGTKPILLHDGSERKFLHDGDTIIMRAYSEKDGVRIGFGECIGKILPAK